MTRRTQTPTVYARGEETRARILSVAIRLFGMEGFDAVSTRMIAAGALVPAPSLRYYFSNKEGLYAACWTSIQTHLQAAMEPALAVAERLLQLDEPERTHLIDACCAMQGAHFDHMMERPDSEAIARFIARHDIGATNGGQKLSMGNGEAAIRMVTCYTQLVVRISGGNLDWKGALIVAGLVNGQLSAIVAKRSGLADFGVDLSGERLAWLKRTIRQQTIAALLLHCA